MIYHFNILAASLIYMGCFGSVNNKTLVSSNITSIQSCITNCISLKYLYAGLQNGLFSYLLLYFFLIIFKPIFFLYFSSYCYCLNAIQVAVSDSNCNITCENSNETLCGSYEYLSIYLTDINASLSFIYMGCYVDQIVQRDLSNNFLLVSSQMNLKMCITYCSNLLRTYAALQNG